MKSAKLEFCGREKVLTGIRVNYQWNYTGIRAEFVFTLTGI